MTTEELSPIKLELTHPIIHTRKPRLGRHKLSLVFGIQSSDEGRTDVLHVYDGCTAKVQLMPER